MTTALDERLRTRTVSVVPLVGPAGSGKTQLIAAALSRLDEPAVHVCVAPRRGSLLRFGRDLVDALAGVAPGLALGYASATRYAMRRERPALALGEWFARELGAGVLTIAIDDLRYASDDALHFIVHAVGLSSPDVRYVLGSRDATAWPLGLWLARSLACVPIALPHDPSVPAEDDYDASVARDVRTWLATLDEPQVALARTIALLPAFDDTPLATTRPAREVITSLAHAIPYARTAGRVNASFRVALHDATEHVCATAFACASEAMAAADAGARLRLAADAGEPDDVVAALERWGFAAIDDGAADIVDDAIAGLPGDVRRTSALALALEAKRESELGRHDIAESWYLHAATVARDDEVRARVQWMLATDLLRRSRADAIELLEGVARAATSAPFVAMTAASLGAAYAALGRADDARAAIAQALASIDAWHAGSRAGIRALVYRQAAYVYLCDHDPARAASFARRAIALAERCGLDDIVAAALSVLVAVAISYDDDVEAALDGLQRLERCAQLLDNAYLLRYARLAQLDAYGERAAWSDVDRCETLLAAQELENDAIHADETLLRIRALRAASVGNFAAACALLAASSEAGGTPELHVLRHAEIATYAAAAGDRELAARTLRETDLALEAHRKASPDAVVVRARVQLALVASLIGDAPDARRRLESVAGDAARFRRVEALHAAAKRIVAFDGALADSDCMALLESFSAMHARGFGGLASVLGALPMAIVRLAS